MAAAAYNRTLSLFLRLQEIGVVGPFSPNVRSSATYQTQKAAPAVSRIAASSEEHFGTVLFWRMSARHFLKVAYQHEIDRAPLSKVQRGYYRSCPRGHHDSSHSPVLDRGHSTCVLHCGDLAMSLRSGKIPDSKTKRSSTDRNVTTVRNGVRRSEANSLPVDSRSECAIYSSPSYSPQHLLSPPPRATAALTASGTLLA